MKKLTYICAIILSIISFTGCYADRVDVYERPPVGRVIVAPALYYYRSAPVSIEHYRSHRYYSARGHNGFSNGYRGY